jgi:small subunit ribosomal protein S10
MVSYIEISFKSYEHILIENSVQQIKSFMPINWALKFIYLPNKIKKITVLRSPHIDKKSREQFQMKFYKQKMIIIPLENKTVSHSLGSVVTELSYSDFQLIYLFLNNIKQCPFSGVQIQIQIIYKSYLK